MNTSQNTPSFSPFKRIVLIGFRGSGKTTLGKHLANILEWQYISTDDQLTHELQTSMADFIKRAGWAAFRKKETQIITQFKTTPRAIIDCGGGVIEAPHNMSILSPDSLVIWVDANLADLYQRLENDTGRPLLSQSDMRTDIEVNYKRREVLYQYYSHQYINTSRPDSLVQLVELLKQAVFSNDAI